MPAIEVAKAKKKSKLKKAPKPIKVTTVVKAKASPKMCVVREDCFRVLNEDNVADSKLEPKLSKEELLNMYRYMLMTRVYDERGMMLQRQGRIGFYVPSFGQEAIQIGTASAMQKQDWSFPSYREPGIWLYRGMDPYRMFCNLFGNKDDFAKGRQMPVHYSDPEHRIFSVSSPIATQIIQGVGAALAAKLQKKDEVALSYIGDGGTSESDFHTGLTFAGAYKAPTVIICTNNQYAISVPVFKQTAAVRISDKALGYGMPGIAVDGNDVLAVYSATKQAVDRARRGEGPTFIECFTLRMGPHSSSDDPTRYRDAKLYDAWVKRDPIIKFRSYLERKKLWDEKKEKALLEELKATFASAVERAEKAAPPGLEDLFSDVYAEMTPQLERQRDALIAEGELRGKFENTSEAFPL